MRARGAGMGAVPWLLCAGCDLSKSEAFAPYALGQTTLRQVVAARRATPNVVLLVDRSGSMAMGTEGDPDCRPNGSICLENCPCSCETRLGAVQAGLHRLLIQEATTARFAMAAYPSQRPDACDRTTGVVAPLPQVDDDDAASLQTNAVQLDVAVQSLRASGGSSTDQSPLAVGETENFSLPNDGRDDLVILITDGISSCSPSSVAKGCSESEANAADCLNVDGPLAAVIALRQRGLRTVVVSPEPSLTSGIPTAVLNALSVTGGLACSSRLGESCEDPRRGVRAYWYVDEVAQLLRSMRSTDADPCRLALSALPSDRRLFLSRSMATPCPPTRATAIR